MITGVDVVTTTATEKRAHVFVCECLFEFVIGHEAHARLDRISDDESRTARIQPAHAVRAHRLADYGEQRLALEVQCRTSSEASSPSRRRKEGTHFSAELRARLDKLHRVGDESTPILRYG